MDFTKDKTHNIHTKYIKKNIQNYSRVCNVNYHLIDKYEKLYDEYLNDFNFGPNNIRPNNSNPIENFTDDINNKCYRNMSIIYDDLNDLCKKIDYRIKDANLNINSRKAQSDPVIKSLINNMEPRLINRCDKLSKNLDDLFLLFYNDYSTVAKQIKLKDYKYIVSQSDEVLFDNFLNEKGIKTKYHAKNHTIKNKIPKNRTIEAFGIFGTVKKIFGIMKSVMNFFGMIFKLIGKVMKYIGPFIKKVFSLAKKAFIFVRDNFLPMIKRIIQFVWSAIKLIPTFIRQIIKLYLWYWGAWIKVIKNFVRCPLIPPIIFILIFFGIQIYIKYITDLPLPVPPIIPAIFGLIITIHQLYFNGDQMYSIQNKLINYIVPLIRPKTSKKVTAKDNIIYISEVILPKILKNLPIIIIICMIVPIVVKFLMKIYIDKFTKKISSLL